MESQRAEAVEREGVVLDASLPLRGDGGEADSSSKWLLGLARRTAAVAVFGSQAFAVSLCGARPALAGSHAPTPTHATWQGRLEGGKQALGACGKKAGSKLAHIVDYGAKTSTATLSKVKELSSRKKASSKDGKKGRMGKKVDSVMYSTFYHAVKSGKVKNVKFDENTPKIYFEVSKSGASRWLSTKRVPSDASLLPLLIQKKVAFGTRNSVSGSVGKVLATVLLLWLPLVPLFLFVRRQIQQQQGMGRSNTTKRRNLGGKKGKGSGSNQRVPEVTFKDVAGADYAIEELQEIVDFLNWKQRQMADLRKVQSRRGRSKYATAFLGSLNVFRLFGAIWNKLRGTTTDKPSELESREVHSKVGQALGSPSQALGGVAENVTLKDFIKMPRGVLLSGPPGTGKTLLAKAVAGEASVPFFACSASEFVELFVGRGAARVRDLFKQARLSSPSIVFIDEIDAVGGKRGAGFNEERDQTLNQLLTELDGFNESAKDGEEVGPNVLLICATNRPEVLDDALLRPGRLSRKVKISLPDEKGRKDIALVYLRDMPLQPLGATRDQRKLEVYYAELIAAGTGGCSGADIANVVNEAVLMATRRSAPQVSANDVLQGIERTKSPISRDGQHPFLSTMSQEVPKWIEGLLTGRQNVVRAQQRMP